MLGRAALRGFVSDERGSVTAEFALTIPAVLLVLGIALGSVHLSAERVLLVSLASDVSRLEARGDWTESAARATQYPSAELHRTTGEGVLCVTATARPGSGILSAIAISATACAATSTSVPTADAGG